MLAALCYANALHGSFVIDDGSADNSVAIIRQISDPRVRLVQKDALGICAAANRGTAKARATVIARMDADDFSHPARLEKQLSPQELADLVKYLKEG